MFRAILIFAILWSSSHAFQCSPDTILRMATDKRAKQLERECHEEKTAGSVCETKDDLETSWDEFEQLSEQYKKAVSNCRQIASKIGPKVDHINTGTKRSGHQRKRRHGGGFTAKERHRAEDPINSGYGKRNEAARRIKRCDFPGGSGINEMVAPIQEQHDRINPVRCRRQVCMSKGKEQINKMQEKFTDHCERDNICLPDEDMPEGIERDNFKQLHKQRAQKYSAYLTELYKCYGKIA